jgi:hypothetical protein
MDPLLRRPDYMEGDLLELGTLGDLTGKLYLDEEVPIFGGLEVKYLNLIPIRDRKEYLLVDYPYIYRSLIEKK